FSTGPRLPAQVAGEGDLIRGSVVAAAGGDDLTVLANRDACGELIAAEVSGEEPDSVEGEVEAPILLEARQRKVARASHVPRSRDDDLAVMLKRHRMGFHGTRAG